MRKKHLLLAVNVLCVNLAFSQNTSVLEADSTTNEDAYLKVLSNKSNSYPNSNGFIHFQEDNGNLNSFLGHTGSNGFAFNGTLTGSLANALAINTPARFFVGVGNAVTAEFKSTSTSFYGNVGIGNATPGYLLHVAGESKFDEQVRLEPEYGGGLDFGEGWLSYTINANDTYVVTHVGTGGAELEIRNVDGQVGNSTATFKGSLGIGVLPTSKIHVHEGSLAGSNHVTTRWQTAAGGGLTLQVSDLSLANPAWRFNTYAGESLRFSVGGTDRMHLDPSGNVGIGTTTPTSSLQVTGSEGFKWEYHSNDSKAKLLIESGSGTANPAIKFYRWAGTGATYYPGHIEMTQTGGVGRMDFNVGSNAALGSETLITAMSIVKTGNVGIGTTNPGSILDVANNGESVLRVTDNTASEYTELIQRASDGNFDISRVGTGNVDFSIQKDGDLTMAVSTGGNVGIGTTSPDQKTRRQRKDPRRGSDCRPLCPWPRLRLR